MSDVQPVLRLAAKAKNLISLERLFNPAKVGGGYANAIEVTATLFGADDTDLSDPLETFPITLLYVPNSKGDYQEWSPPLNTVKPRVRYKLELKDAAGYVYRLIDCVGYFRTVT